MDRLIREMSYLFTKQRFWSFRKQQKTSQSVIVISLSVSVLLLTPSLNLLKTLLMMSGESMKNHYALRCNAIDIAMGKGHKVTDIQWAHPGWFGTAEKGDTTQ